MCERDNCYEGDLDDLERGSRCSGIEILTGKSNPKLAEDVADILKHNIDQPVSKFEDGERRVVISSPLRRKSVFIIQPTGRPKVNARIMELYAMLDAARRESPDEITAIIPYFGYARQDRREQPGAPIMAAVVARQIFDTGADRVVTIDLHSEQSMAAVDRPWDNLYASKVLVPALIRFGINPRKTAVATPDKGGFLRAIKYAEMLGTDKIAIAYKQRDIDLSVASKALFMLGDVSGMTVIITDDILASGSTLFDAAAMMKANGAKHVFGAITHGLFLDDKKTGRTALGRLDESPIEKLFITDTLRQKGRIRHHPKIEIVSVAPLLADVIYQIHTGEHMDGRFR